MLYIYINVGLLQNITVEPTDSVAVPPGSSMITEGDWSDMCIAAGGEANLIAQLEVVDMRGDL